MLRPRTIPGRALYRTSTRLTLIFVLTTVALALCVVFMIRAVLPEHPRNQLSQRLALHAVTALGPAPRQTDVERLSREIGVALMMIDGPVELRSARVRFSRDDVEGLVSAHPGQTSFEAAIEGDRYFVLRSGGKIWAMGDFVAGVSALARAKLIGGLVAMLAILGAAFIAMRRTVEPLAPLSDTVRAIGEGDLDQFLEVRGGGEIATLARAINEMAQKLSRAEDVKRDMLVAIGHEFSSPIARMMFQAERIEDPVLRAKLTDNLLRINLLFRTLISVEALQESRGDSATEPLDFPQVIREIGEKAGEGAVEFDLPAEPRALLFDRMRLEILLNNFISNARRYAPGSRIELCARHGADMLTLVVADRGPGVPETVLASLGEPFMREDRARRFNTGGGMGLGLYLCGRIAARAQGRMKISNRPGGGLSVRVDLPCTALAPTIHRNI